MPLHFKGLSLVGIHGSLRLCSVIVAIVYVHALAYIQATWPIAQRKTTERSKRNDSHNVKVNIYSITQLI